jgi:hypothetical protein
MSIVHFPTLKPLKITNIIKHCSNKSLISEMGGVVGQNGFMDECWGRKFKNGKVYVDINDIKKNHGHNRNLVTWHMHPHFVSWWPSSQNIITTTRNFDLPGLLFTKYGIWIYYKTDKFIKNYNGIKKAVENMEKEIFKGKMTLQYIIDNFIISLNKFGIIVHFFWYNQYTEKLIVDFLKTIPILKNFGNTKPINLNNIVLIPKVSQKRPRIK